MPFDKTLPVWNAQGVEPPSSLKNTGWSINQKPPADFFNWQWNSVYQVLNELHQYALHTEKLGVANGVATLGADSKLIASQLPAIGSAQITDGSITNNDLATDVKVGSLATLTTTVKTTVVAAVNEVRSNLNSHTGDATIHVTPADKTAWNGKAETTVATTSANGLMSSADKTKLDGVSANANNYVHPASHPPSIITQDATNRFVTDTEKANWNTAVSNLNSHTGDATIHVTPADKTAWNGKAETTVATTSANGLMSSADKTKLDGVSANANNYVHPASHPPSIITQDATNRFVTDTEKANWNTAVSNLNSHTGNGMLHLATAEKTAVSQLADDSVSSWVTATLLNGWTTKFDRTVRFRRVGNMLHISGGVGGGTTGDGTSVFFLPVGLRPDRTTVVPIIAGGVGANPNGNAQINRMVIHTTGSVTFSYNYAPEGWMVDIMIPL